MSICLSMIVKNEEKIITRLLESVVNFVDVVCICDTGSTDKTIEKISSFVEKNNIKCYIYYLEFVNFEYNRNYVLEKSKSLADYILLLDADMILKHNIDKNSLTKDCYYISQVNDDFEYTNIRLIKSNKKFYYFGVTHEVILSIENVTIELLPKEKIKVIDYMDGGSKENKLTRDKTLLLKELQQNKINGRYIFYLANTYFSLGEYKNAIKFYLLKIKIDNWDQEIWYSNYRIGISYMILKKYELAMKYFLEAYEILPLRIENLYYMIKYYRVSKKHQTAKIYLELALKILKKDIDYSQYLFLEKKIYNSYIFEEENLINFS